MNIRIAHLFPFHIKILGYVLVLSALPMFIVNQLAALILAAVGVFMAFSYHGVEFRKEDNQFREYNSFFLLKFGTWEPITRFEKIFINPVRTSQYIYTKVNTGSTIRQSLFASFLKISDTDKIPLMRMKNREKLIGELQELAEYLDIPIQDNSEE